MRNFVSLAAALVLGSASIVSAHAGLIEKEAKQGAATRFTLYVPHGCGSEATLRVRVRIPAGIVAVKPMPKANWDLEIKSGTYSDPQTLSGSTLNEGVVELIWSGNLPDAHYDEFVFRGTVSENAEVGAPIYIPAVQECANGVERWIEIPKEGQTSHELDNPAPNIIVVPADAHHHH